MLSLEVGHVVDHCKWLLQSARGLMVTHIRKQANKVVHSLARFSCQSIASVYLRLFLETIMNNFSNE